MASHETETTRPNETDTRATLRAARETSDRIWQDIRAGRTERYRILTGDRPTGFLHIGHYFGTLKSRVELQNLGINTTVLIADYQVITDRDNIGNVREYVLNLVADYLAAGIDPAKSTIFCHSQVPAIHEMLVIFLSLVTEAELHRNPTVKAEMEAAARPMTGLLLTYPVHQAADILCAQANLVPVGQDQLPHLEQTRVVAKRFNKRYPERDAAGNKVKDSRGVLPLAQALLGRGSMILGTDGQKMSKSRHNTVELGASAEETAKIIKKAVTDSNREITYDPVGRPEVANLLLIASLCTGQSPEDLAAEIGSGGGGALKQLVTEALNEHLAAHRARRAQLLEDPGYLWGVLREGNEKVADLGADTLRAMKQAMGMNYGF